MINTRLIFRIMGSLLFIEAGLLLLAIIVSLCYGENDRDAFIITWAISTVLGILMKLFGRNATNSFGRRDGYFVVSITWVLFSLVGMLPFLFSGYLTSPADALFETMSGFTSTGCSVINNLDSYPHALLFWRSITQWVGGLGIIFFTIALLPMLGVGNVKLFAAEATGLKMDRIHPKISTTAKWIWTLYIGITAICAITLYVAGMDVFDSINHALTCISTGGYSTHQSSIAWFNSPLIEYIISGFMFISGINFTLLYLMVIKHKFRPAFGNRELGFYTLFTVCAVAFFTIALVRYNNYDIESAFRAALFQTTSIATSTGYISNDYMTWLPATWPILALLMFIGGCAGSTAGGMKYVRLNIMAKITRNEFKHLIHPTAVIPIRDGNGTVLPSSTASSLMAFIFLYIVIACIGGVILIASGEQLLDAFSMSLSAISNNGPAIGYKIGATHTWAELNDTAKYACSILMLVGRLEIFSVLMLFTPRFWERR